MACWLTKQPPKHFKTTINVIIQCYAAISQHRRIAYDCHLAKY